MRLFKHLILLLLPFFCFAQVKNTPSNKANGQTVMTKADSLTITAKDSLSIQIPNPSSESIKLYIQPPASGTDYFKYIFPIVTLFLGIATNKFLEFWTDKKKIKKTGERWSAELSSLQQPITSQIEELKKYLVEQQKNEFVNDELIRFQGLDGEDFKTLFKSDLIKFFEKNKKKSYSEAVKSANKLNGFVNVLVSHSVLFTNKFDDYRQQESVRTSILNKALQSLIITYRKYIVLMEKTTEGNLFDNPYFSTISDLFDTQIYPFMAEGNFNPFKMETDFILPLIQVFGPIRLDDRINNLSDAVTDCLNAIKGIKMQRRYLTEDFERIISLYQEDLKDLEMVKKEIE